MPGFVYFKYRLITLSAGAKGYRLEVGLLRPLSWLEERGITQAGAWTALSMPEMGAEGEFQVVAIGPCPEIEDGPGRVVTGEFRHSRGMVYDLWVSGESNPIGVTAGHPFWSVDRKTWVPLKELWIGERVQCSGHTALVLKIEERGVEPVYNLEVDADHCYRVGEQGILVHNASAPPAWCTSNKMGYRHVIPEDTLFIRTQLTAGYCANAPEDNLYVYIVPVQKEVQGILQNPDTATGGSDTGSALASFFKPKAYWVNKFTLSPRPTGQALRDALADAYAMGELPPLALASDASAGHIYGQQFGGPGKPYTTPAGDMALPDNLFPSAAATEVALAPLEKIWRDNAKKGNKVCVNWKLNYPGGGCKFADRMPSRCRPSELVIEYWIDCGGTVTHTPPTSIKQ